MSDSVRLQRRQPTRLPCPWDSPGKNTGVGCHFLLQRMEVKSESEVTQLFPTPSNPMDSSLPGFSVHGIFQARVLEWGAIAFSNIQCIVGRKIPFPQDVYILIPTKFFQCVNNWKTKITSIQWTTNKQLKGVNFWCM